MLPDYPTGRHVVAHHFDGGRIVLEIRDFGTGGGKRRAYQDRERRLHWFSCPASERLAFLVSNMTHPPDTPASVSCRLDPFVLVGSLSGLEIEIENDHQFASALWRLVRAEGGTQ